MKLQVELQHQFYSSHLFYCNNNYYTSYFLPCSDVPGDYDELNGIELAFNIGVDRVCHNVTINEDNICEQPAESFLLRLSYISGQMPITINPRETLVFITDDIEPECSKYTGL